MKKIVIIDGNSLIFRAYFAVPAFFSPEGVPTGAVYGFANMLYSIMSQHKGADVAVAFDVKEKTFRHKIYPEYKGTRKKTDEDLLLQFPIVKEMLGLFGIPVLEAPGYEADDILGTLAHQAGKKGIESVVYTGDKDALQLVGGGTSVYITLRGVSSTECYDEAKVVEKMGVRPDQVVDYKSLKGDTSDNIPGAKGIGDKTAIKLITEYGTTENILAHAEEVKPPRIGKILAESKDIVMLSKELATISVEAPVSLDDISMGEFQSAEVIAFFRKYGFASLIKKYQKAGLIDGAEASVADDSKPSTSSRANRKTAATLSGSLSSSRSNSAGASFAQSAPFAGAEFQEVFGEVKLPNIVRTDINDILSKFASGSTCDLESENHSKELGSDKKKNDDQSEIYVGLALSDGEFESFYILHNGLFYGIKTLEDFLALKPLLENRAIKKKTFSSKKLYLFCFEHGIDLCGVVFDVTVAAYLLNPSRKEYGIAEISRDFGHEYKFSPAKQLSLLDGGMDGNSTLGENIGEHNGEDDSTDGIDGELRYKAAVTERLTQILEKGLACSGMTALYDETELPLVKVLADIEHTGFRMDSDILREIGKGIEDKIATLEKRVHELAGEAFNISSPKQLSVILFEKLGLPHGKKTKTGYSTNKEILDKLAGEYEIAGLVVEYRSYTKLKSSYVDSLLSLVKDGKIHTSLNQKIAVTGRLSSTEPNLQNIPIRLEEGRLIRKAFLADEGCMLVGADYSQIELRVLAHLSEDSKLIKAFNEGADVHRATASEVFGVSPEEVTTTQRSHAKEVNFGIIYGMGDFRLSESLGISVFEARNYIEAYFDTYGKVKTYMEGVVEGAREHRFVETILGRKRTIPELFARNKNVQAHGTRMARNTVIQGSAADIIKIAMMRLYDRLREKGFKAKIILQIHDELILNVPEGELDDVKILLKEAMEDAYKLRVPLKVDMNVAKSWYDAK